MTLNLNLPSDVEQAYIAEAQARGLPVSDVMAEILVAARPSQSRVIEDPDEWMKKFKEWSASHEKDDLPELSDEAMSREFIYRERGL